MKFLILLFLISCGNKEAHQMNQFTFIPLKQEGALEFLGDKNLINFRIQNESPESFHKDLIRSQELIHKKPEYQVLEFENFVFPMNQEKQFELRIKSDQTRALVYIEGKFLRKLPYEGFTLSSSDLNKISSKKAFLAFYFNEQAFFKRVTLLDQDEIKTYFIPKVDPRLPIEAKNLNLEDIFHGNDHSIEWYKKETPEGNLLFIRSDKSSLREIFLVNSKKEEQDVLRSDGISAKEITLNEGLHFLKIIPQRFQNSYYISKEIRQRTLNERCNQYTAIINAQSLLYVDFQTLENELVSPFSHMPNFRKTEVNTPDGTFWYISFYVPGTFQFAFRKRPDETFFYEGAQTQHKWNDCSIHKRYRVLRNLEAKFGLEIESYLEPEL